jgi:hypothetical protein
MQAGYSQTGPTRYIQRISSLPFPDKASLGHLALQVCVSNAIREGEEGSGVMKTLYLTCEASRTSSSTSIIELMSLMSL